MCRRRVRGRFGAVAAGGVVLSTKTTKPGGANSDNRIGIITLDDHRRAAHVLGDNPVLDHAGASLARTQGLQRQGLQHGRFHTSSLSLGHKCDN